MTVVACILYFTLHGVNQNRLVTGTLVVDLHEVLIVDIENAADALGLHDHDYAYYTIPSENCRMHAMGEKI